MLSKLAFVVVLFGILASPVSAEQVWEQWPPKDYLLSSLVEAVPKTLDTYHPETGKFGTEPWICRDQDVLFFLAVAWAIDDPSNPWYHNNELLAAIAKGGEALVDEMDEDGKWIFRKKDNSTWGQIHMPWTYSRWIRAYVLVRDDLPEASREKWERGLLLGFEGIRSYMDGNVHNIPAHHAMALYIAGEAFENVEWSKAAAEFMARVVEKQDPAGFWSENFGPVVGYNRVYVDALGVYHHFSHDPIALDALRRSALFHSSVLWPDGSSVSCIDERVIYKPGATAGNVGFTWTPEGRGYLLMQLPRYSNGGEKPVSADYAASMLLYGSTGEAIVPVAGADEAQTTLGDNDAGIVRKKPWQWALSAYACPPVTSRWIQDRHNLVDVYHDVPGLIIGGGNTKLQPYWSTFTVGDPSLLAHTPGDESPDFTPDIDLLWTPTSASIGEDKTTLELEYGDAQCSVRITPEEGSLVLIYTAPSGKGVEAHVPFLLRTRDFTTAKGETILITEEPVEMTSEELGEHFDFGGVRVTVPDGASLRWPAKQHNPYKKDGSSSLDNAKLVLTLPFTDTDEHRVILTPRIQRSLDIKE
jgi:hypothetical protein